MGIVEHQHGSYMISDDPSRLDLNAIWDFKDGADSSKSNSINSLERALAYSLCIGAYSMAGNQVGFDSTDYGFRHLLFPLRPFRARGPSSPRPVQNDDRCGTESFATTGSVALESHCS
jgi:hypothetical protein